MTTQHRIPDTNAASGSGMTSGQTARTPVRGGAIQETQSGLAIPCLDLGMWGALKQAEVRLTRLRRDQAQLAIGLQTIDTRLHMIAADNDGDSAFLERQLLERQQKGMTKLFEEIAHDRAWLNDYQSLDLSWADVQLAEDLP
jgi:hypothetical protein